MNPYPHQVELFEKGIAILKEHMILYLACEERTGKTLPAIMIAEHIKVQNILVLTKKNAINGWIATLGQYPHGKSYKVTNYHQAKKLDPEYDLVILDEAHNYISSFPKTSKIWDDVRKLTEGNPLIFLSATPFAQGYQLLYHQLKLSDWSPWSKWTDAYQWFGSFGIPENIYVNDRLVPVYTNTDPICFDLVKHLFITLTRQEIGFSFEPEDKLHYVPLNQKTKDVYNYLIKKRAINLNGYDLVCDSVMKLRTSLHSLEGGTVIISAPDENKKGKMKRNYLVLGNDEKIQYIKKTWGDTLGLVIMYNYKAEKIKLEQHFKYATLLQSTSHAEGTDLSTYDHLVIYSQDFSTARHSQRRARQANKLRGTEIIVHYLVIAGGISEEVYTAVSINKENYVDKLYKGRLL